MASTQARKEDYSYHSSSSHFLDQSRRGSACLVPVLLCARRVSGCQNNALSLFKLSVLTCTNFNQKHTPAILLSSVSAVCFCVKVACTHLLARVTTGWTCRNRHQCPCIDCWWLCGTGRKQKRQKIRQLVRTVSPFNLRNQASVTQMNFHMRSWFCRNR